MSEELAFHETGRDGGAIHFDERAVAARTEIVQGAGHQFLAGSSFAVNQDSGRRAGH